MALRLIEDGTAALQGGSVRASVKRQRLLFTGCSFAGMNFICFPRRTDYK
jgi:hypothetical protein